MKRVFFRYAIAWLSAAFWMAACAGGENGSADDQATCSPATERCPCDEGACNDGLVCRSDVCVEEGGGTNSTGTGGTGQTTGSTSASSGGDTSTGATSATGVSSGGGGNGGATGAGGQPMTGNGGMTGSSMGGSSTAGGTGGAGATGGASGGTGGAACEADTQTDPMNCGACDRICKNQEPEFKDGGCAFGECCVDGSCGPYFSDCFSEDLGFSNCEEICASVGEECVERGCWSATWWGFPLFGTSCEQFLANIGSDPYACDAPISWEGAGSGIKVRCCCTDTQP